MKWDLGVLLVLLGVLLRILLWILLRDLTRLVVDGLLLLHLGYDASGAVGAIGSGAWCWGSVCCARDTWNARAGFGVGAEQFGRIGMTESPFPPELEGSSSAHLIPLLAQ